MEECAVGERETRPLKAWKANEWPLVSHQSILPCSIPSFCTCRGNVTRFLNWERERPTLPVSLDVRVTANMLILRVTVVFYVR